MPSIYVSAIQSKRRELYQLYGTRQDQQKRQVMEEIKRLVVKLNEDNAVRHSLSAWVESHQCR